MMEWSPPRHRSVATLRRETPHELKTSTATHAGIQASPMLSLFPYALPCPIDGNN